MILLSLLPLSSLMARQTQLTAYLVWFKTLPHSQQDDGDVDEDDDE